MPMRMSFCVARKRRRRSKRVAPPQGEQLLAARSARLKRPSKQVLIFSAAASMGSSDSSMHTVLPTIAVWFQDAISILAMAPGSSAADTPGWTVRCSSFISWSIVSRMYSGLPSVTRETSFPSSADTPCSGTPRYMLMYSLMFSSVSPFSDTSELLAKAFFTAMLDLSACLQRTRPAICFSFCTSSVSSAAILQKINSSFSVVLGKRLVPYSNCSTTSTGVCFFSTWRSAITTFTASKSKISFISTLDLDFLSNSCICGRCPTICGGMIFSRAWALSVGRESFR
mmetsp:Transcript_44432/g.117453  ORF Transcript_44432/g.117453 Transcript_44432/m.117453 type:complete len:284 (+) Transcript_44432:349-1200(+)